MSCPKTEHMLKQYFADDLGLLAREEMERHLTQCDACNHELEALLLVQSDLMNWQDQRTPHWDRGVELFKREHRDREKQSLFFSPWQWLPTAASFAMLALVMVNTSIVIGDEGFSVSFGANSDNQFESQLAALQQDQQEQLTAFIARVENRQDSNNVQLMQAVFDQTQQTTAENLERIYAFFEEQRLQDLEDMRVGYQELVNNDFETIRSLEQLAQFVSFGGEVR